MINRLLNRRGASNRIERPTLTPWTCKKAKAETTTIQLANTMIRSWARSGVANANNAARIQSPSKARCTPLSYTKPWAAWLVVDHGVFNKDACNT